MSFSVLVQLCGGVPYFVLHCCLGFLLTVISLFLAVRVKRVPLLVAFLPLTTLPIMAGACTALLGTLNSIGVQLSPTNEIATDSGFLLLMNIVPILFGAVIAVPPALIAMVARLILTWNASGVRLFAEKREPDDADADSEQQEANEYLRQLVRPR